MTKTIEPQEQGFWHQELLNARWRRGWSTNTEGVFKVAAQQEDFLRLVLENIPVALKMPMQEVLQLFDDRLQAEILFTVLTYDRGKQYRDFFEDAHFPRKGSVKNRLYNIVMHKENDSKNLREMYTQAWQRVVQTVINLYQNKKLALDEEKKIDFLLCVVDTEDCVPEKMARKIRGEIYCKLVDEIPSVLRDKHVEKIKKICFSILSAENPEILCVLVDGLIRWKEMPPTDRRKLSSAFSFLGSKGYEMQAPVLEECEPYSAACGLFLPGTPQNPVAKMRYSTSSESTLMKPDPQEFNKTVFHEVFGHGAEYNWMSAMDIHASFLSLSEAPFWERCMQALALSSNQYHARGYYFKSKDNREYYKGQLNERLANWVELQAHHLITNPNGGALTFLCGCFNAATRGTGEIISNMQEMKEISASFVCEMNKSRSVSIASRIFLSERLIILVAGVEGTRKGFSRDGLKAAQRNVALMLGYVNSNEQDLNFLSAFESFREGLALTEKYFKRLLEHYEPAFRIVEAGETRHQQRPGMPEAQLAIAV